MMKYDGNGYIRRAESAWVTIVCLVSPILPSPILRLLTRSASESETNQTHPIQAHGLIVDCHQVKKTIRCTGDPKIHPETDVNRCLESP